jgi:hypothetical protein
MILIECKHGPQEGLFDVKIYRTLVGIGSEIDTSDRTECVLLWQGTMMSQHSSGAIHVALASAEAHGIIHDVPRK